MSFDVKTREGSSKGEPTWLKGACLRTSTGGAAPLIFLDFVNFCSNWSGWVLFCILSAADEPGPRWARHPMPDCTSPLRAHRLLKVCVSLWLFHSVCCDAGTGGQPCVEIQALYSSRQLLEWVWIYQPVICAMPLPTPPPSPTHHPELMTASPHLHPIMTRMLRQLKMFTPIAKTLHVPQSGLFSLWWDC